MKKMPIILLFVAICILSGTSKAQDTGTGVGIMIGEPTGFSVKHWLNGTNALDLGLGYSLITNNRKLYISADYLYHEFDLIKSEESFPVYYGFGGRLITQEHDYMSLGVRGVGGIAWFSKKLPIDIFAEIAPVFRLLPSTAIDMDASIGIRYFFQ